MITKQKQTACLGCGSNNTQMLDTILYVPDKMLYKLIKCFDCELEFADPMSVPQNYYDKSDRYLPRQLGINMDGVNEFAKLIATSGKYSQMDLLDFGCGNGSFVKICVDNNINDFVLIFPPILGI